MQKVRRKTRPTVGNSSTREKFLAEKSSQFGPFLHSQDGGGSGSLGRAETSTCLSHLSAPSACCRWRYSGGYHE